MFHADVTLGTLVQTEPHARSAPPARINLQWGLLVQAVPQIRSLHLAAPPERHVNAMLDTREEMDNNAPSAVSTNTKQALGLLLAQIVHQAPPLQLAASQIFHVDVTLGTLVQTEPHARSVPPARINLQLGLLVQAVPQIRPLQLAASQVFHADVTLGTLGQMEPHARSAVSSNTKQDWVQLLALTVH